MEGLSGGTVIRFVKYRLILKWNQIRYYFPRWVYLFKKSGIMCIHRSQKWKFVGITYYIIFLETNHKFIAITFDCRLRLLCGSDSRSLYHTQFRFAISCERRPDKEHQKSVVSTRARGTRFAQTSWSPLYQASRT